MRGASCGSPMPFAPTTLELAAPDACGKLRGARILRRPRARLLRAQTSHATNRRARRGQTQDSMSVERIQQHFRDSAAVTLEALETLAVPIAAAVDALFGALANGSKILA